MRDLRKRIFINSQYCNYYIEDKKTVIAGIMRGFGYKFNQKLPEDKINELETKYRKYNTIINTCTGLFLLVYVYLFVFPYYLDLAKLPIFVSVISLTILPLLFLYILYSVANNNFEKYINTNIGNYEKIKFKPNIYNIEPQYFEKYLKTPRKSVYLVALLCMMFLFYIFVPIVIETLSYNGKYESSIKLAKIYLTLVPIDSNVYSQKAYSEFQLKKYKEAQKDYELANAYSKSDAYDFEVLGSKIAYLPYGEALYEFDLAIDSEYREDIKRFLFCEKAMYLQKYKQYRMALAIYNNLIKDFEQRKDAGFSPEFVYYNRGLIKHELGDMVGGNRDIKKAKLFCTDCNFELKSSLVKY